MSSTIVAPASGARALTAEALPADAVIHSVFAAPIGHADEIDEHLAGAQALRHAVEAAVIVPNHDGLRVIENLVDVLDHQLRDVGNAVQDEIAVRTDEAGKLHVLVVD